MVAGRTPGRSRLSANTAEAYPTTEPGSEPPVSYESEWEIPSGAQPSHIIIATAVGPYPHMVMRCPATSLYTPFQSILRT